MSECINVYKDKRMNAIFQYTIQILHTSEAIAPKVKWLRNTEFMLLEDKMIEDDRIYSSIVTAL